VGTGVKGYKGTRAQGNKDGRVARKEGRGPVSRKEARKVGYQGRGGLVAIKGVTTRIAQQITTKTLDPW